MGLTKRYIELLTTIFEACTAAIRNDLATTIDDVDSVAPDGGGVDHRETAAEEDYDGDSGIGTPTKTTIDTTIKTSVADGGSDTGRDDVSGEPGDCGRLLWSANGSGGGDTGGAKSTLRRRHSSGPCIIVRETAIHHHDDKDGVTGHGGTSGGRVMLFPSSSPSPSSSSPNIVGQFGVNGCGPAANAAAKDGIGTPRRRLRRCGDDWKIVHDSIFLLKAGTEAIIEDEVTDRFRAEQLASWNMLTRTRVSFYRFLTWKLTVVWLLGFLFRYSFLLPARLLIFTFGIVFMVVTTGLVGLFPNCPLKRWLNDKCMLASMQIGARAFSAYVRFYDRQNKAKPGGICVANHTSPIDVMILGMDNVYSLSGQSHSGFMGVIQRALNRAGTHIWFQRGEANDRAKVLEMLKEHVRNPSSRPMLLFPEGTCINNTSVMMFKKGSFEIGTKIYPVAMKYDSRFGDAFWNSSEQGYLEYMLQMMTSWALSVQVWYLPPMERLPGESATSFAARVKKAIAERGGLVDLDWCGDLKRARVSDAMINHQRERYYRHYQQYHLEVAKATSDGAASAATTD